MEEAEKEEEVKVQPVVETEEGQVVDIEDEYISKSF